MSLNIAKQSRNIFRLLRMHQWIKNLLVFVPAFSLEEDALARLPALFAAFAAFCAAASLIYVMNDQIDAEIDTQKEGNWRLPLSSAEHSVPLLTAVLAALAAVLALTISRHSTELALPLGLYVAANFLYSLAGKRIRYVDIFFLSFFFLLRFQAGVNASGTRTSLFGASLTFFFFLWLGAIKRRAEIGNGSGDIPGRPYGYAQLPALRALCGLSAVAFLAVLAAFLSDPSSTAHYSRPGLLWLLPVFYIFTAVQIEMRLKRKALPDDLSRFFLSDPASWAVMGIFFGIIFGARSL